MKKYENLTEFKQFIERITHTGVYKDIKPTIVLCAGTGGQASGANEVLRVIKKHIIQNSLQDKIDIRITGCQGFCEMDPFVIVEPGNHLYPKLKMADIPKVIDSAIKGYIESSLIYKEPKIQKSFNIQSEIPFFKKQVRTILGLNQKIDPVRILSYINNNGYSALVRVFLQNNPDKIINDIKLSGLRGRGGAGFPTGNKWELARRNTLKSKKAYIVCNADEGDPGAYMDRSLLEGNPHGIIEGLLIAGYAIGAENGIIYVRSEYPLAIKHTNLAINQAKDIGLLGRDILGTGFNFDIEIVRGAGAFVCGEETALIKSVEGYRGEPRQRPPYPIEKGINGYPTCINNVETLANIPHIINIGADEYAKIGIPGNTGTKIFSLVGKIRNTGLVEVPLGIKIREIVYDIGGGSSTNARIKAVQTGGPSGGCIPASMFDLSIDYESLAAAGSIMGSGGMIVMDENTCMVDVAKYFMKFLKDESCGKCFTCRKGTQRMYELLDDITKGKADLSHLDLLKELAEVVRDTSMCGLGQSAANPVLSTLRYFRSEYEKHIKQKKCDAFVCKDLVGAPCQTACPIGTEAWRYIAHISRGEYEEAYLTIRETNPLPSVCSRVCDHPCETRCKAYTTGGDPIAIRALKRFITDRIDPFVYKPQVEVYENSNRVAIIGSGPAGLTAAHYLSLKGYKITIYESESQYGGMLTCAIPSYRLPREVIMREISSLMNENITIKCNTALGHDFSIDSLFESGFNAVLLAIGAHKSKPLYVENEDIEGVYPSIEFLKDFNLKGKSEAKGKVGVIGGGNSAIDAARVALRQKDVESVTIIYRRTREEMPAFEEEIEAGIQEGIELLTLVSPAKILENNGKLVGLRCIRNELGEIGPDGRRLPVPIHESEFDIELDTLIIAISEDSGKDTMSVVQKSGINTAANNTVISNKYTLETSRPGVFAAGDVVTGPNTVIDAIAAGKRAALMIDRYLNGVELEIPVSVNLPKKYIEPVSEASEYLSTAGRIETLRAPAEWRKRNFSEVEVTLSPEEAHKESLRCMRCDLEFTMKKELIKEQEVEEELING